MNESIAFTAARQTLTTEGDPKGRERAMIIVEGENTATAILYVPFRRRHGIRVVLIIVLIVIPARMRLSSH